MLGERGVAFHHLAPQFDGIAHSIDGTGELEQEPVAGGLDDTPRCSGIFASATSRLIALSAASRQYRRQPALDLLSPGVHSGDAAVIPLFTIAPSSDRRQRRTRPDGRATGWIIRHTVASAYISRFSE
jgi:hypothetical protein